MKKWTEGGQPWIWLSAGALSCALIMLLGTLGWIAAQGLHHFWPKPIYQLELPATDASSPRALSFLAQPLRSGQVVDQSQDEQLWRLGNRDLQNQEYLWLPKSAGAEFSRPENALRIERQAWGDLFGFAQALIWQETQEDTRQEQRVPAEAAEFWSSLQTQLRVTQALQQQIRLLERREMGRLNQQLEQIRRQLRTSASHDPDTHAALLTTQQQLLHDHERLRLYLQNLYQQAAQPQLEIRLAQGETHALGLDQILRITRPNALSFIEKLQLYLHNIWAFLTENPREANTQGGIFPALYGTLVMVLLMTLLVTPFGVLAAIYLHEYAGKSLLARWIRISVYNLAGIPSIVFGVFGLGFFIYLVGGQLDQWLFADALPAPTLGTPGLIWVSLTLALLTLPVVIVATEEGLARIPRSLRDGSLALGATPAETLWRIILPLATPAMLTGLILAIARAAGEVAPLMLVGVVKLAPTLPLDDVFPYLHLDRKIMHLGYHIFDASFQSPDPEAARPLVYATALVLILLILLLNLSAIRIRHHLRERYQRFHDL